MYILTFNKIEKFNNITIFLFEKEPCLPHIRCLGNGRDQSSALMILSHFVLHAG